MSSTLCTNGHTVLVVTKQGALWGIGANDKGQLGNGGTADSKVPVIIMPSLVKGISIGDKHALILKTDGSLWGMGSNKYGAINHLSARSQPALYY